MGEITAKLAISPKFGDFGAFSRLPRFWEARNAGPGGPGKCYLGAARFSYVKSYLRGEGGGGLFCLVPCAPAGEVLSRTRPVHTSGMYGAETHPRKV